MSIDLDDFRELDKTAPIRVSERAAANNVAGERFGKYVLVGEIATGGMAELFLGVQHGLEGFVKVVVIKRVLPHFSDNAQFIRMFIDEARIAARLDHPNIVRTYEFGQVDGQYYTVMEYLPGEDLRGLLRRLSKSRQLLPLHVAGGIAMQLCAGLHCAHQLTDTTGAPLNLVHRDVSPANIIITYGGEVKIIDFGVAKTNATATVTGTLKGKLAYMSPEQVLGRGVDRRSDIFSAGIVMWELLTGRRLFGSATDAATLYAILNHPVSPPSRYRSDVPRELDAIVMRALARAAGDRYGSAEEMETALDSFLSRQPKYDARVLAGLVEGVFGTSRAEAKRAISQTRSLGHNISLVMKLRREVQAELAANLETLPSRADASLAGPPLPVGGPLRRVRLLAGAAALVACIAGGVIYAATRPGELEVSPTTSASLVVESVPPGAAISIDNEPTGLKTPATLSGLATKHVALRLQLPGYGPVAAAIDVPATGTLEKRFQLAAAVGRLVLAGLPTGATVFVDGSEFQAGDVIDIAGGVHEVRVIAEGKTVVAQQLETTSGDQVWRLAGDRLVSH